MSTQPTTSPSSKRQKTSSSTPTTIIPSSTTTEPTETMASTTAAASTNTDNSPIPLLVKKLSEHASLPTKGSAFAAGYDIYASKDSWIPGHGKGLVETDISIAVPAGTYGRIAPRSGLASKHHIDVGAGVIDADYRGPVKVLLFNFGPAEFAVKKGDRIAQLVLERIYVTDVVEVKELEESVRGAGGFGSTG